MKVYTSKTINMELELEPDDVDTFSNILEAAKCYIRDNDVNLFNTNIERKLPVGQFTRQQAQQMSNMMTRLFDML